MGSRPPRFAKAALQRLMEVLRRGRPAVQAAALALLHAIFAVPGVRLGAPSSLTATLLAPLPPLLSGPHARLAQQAPPPPPAPHSLASNWCRNLDRPSPILQATGLM